MSAPDRQRIEALLEQAWQRPAIARETFVRTQAADDPDLLEAVLERLRAGGGPADAGATIDLPAAPDLGATIDLPESTGLDATIDLPGAPDPEATVDLHATGGSAGSEPDDSKPGRPRIPETIAGFRLHEVLGAGGMGEVYLAEQLNPNRKVALKVIRSAIASPESRKRFEVEAHTLARLSHPGIAQVFSAGVHEDASGAIPFFAMEYISGAEELIDWVEHNGLDRRERLRLFQRVCEAVAHGHQRGVMHLDLKPGNILVDVEGQPKVIDFGVAQMEEEQSSVEGRRQVVGTLQYMPPEQVRGDEDMDISCDVYALGVVLYQLLADELPYEIDVTSFSAATTSVLEAPTPSLLAIRPDLGPDLDAVVRKALAKDARERYRSAADLGDEIGRYLADEPVNARVPTTRESVLRFVRKHRAATTAIVSISLVVIIALVAVSVFAYRAERARSEEQRQRQLADAALERANAERKRLFKITLFQTEMIKAIEPVNMGEGLRSAWLESLRSRLEKDGLPESEVEATVAEQMRILDEFNHTDIAVKLIDNHILRQALDSAPRWFTGEPELEADLREIVADAYEQIGLYAEASPEYERALEIRNDLFGPGHIRTLESKSDLGQLRLSQGRNDEARELLLATLEGRREVLGEEDPETIGSMQNLGMVLYRQGDLDGAESIWKEALGLSEAVNPPGDPVTTTLESNLGVLYLDLDRLDDAEEFLLRDLRNSEQLNGPLDSSTLDAKLNLGVLALKRGDVARATEIYREVLKGARKALGDRHPRTLRSMANLGSLLLQQGQLEEAVDLLEAAYLTRLEELGASHPDTFFSLQLLAEGHMVGGDMVSAGPYVREVASTFGATAGPTDPRSIMWRFRLGLVHFDAQRFEEAETVFLDLRAVCRTPTVADAAPTCAVLPNVLVDMYAAWHETEPDAGHDERSAAWQAVLEGAADPPDPS